MATDIQIKSLLLEANALVQNYRSLTASVCHHPDVPPGGWIILQIIARRGSLSVPQIARISMTSRQNIQVLINRLESSGCTISSQNPSHKRSLLIHLTERGKAVLETSAEREATMLNPLQSTIPEDRMVSATALLRKVRELLSSKPVGSSPEPMPYVSTEEGGLQESSLPFNLL
jgi:DNA-binding MarR family transcriptional regulator